LSRLVQREHAISKEDLSGKESRFQIPYHVVQPRTFLSQIRFTINEEIRGGLGIIVTPRRSIAISGAILEARPGTLNQNRKYRLQIYISAGA
jgi:hypothetical protein